MIFTRESNPWRRRFAFLPISFSDGPTTQTVWLQWVWVRSGGLCTEVSIEEPKP